MIMSTRTLPLTDVLRDYLLRISLREHPLLQRLRQETATLPQSAMQIAPEQGQFMAMLARLLGARRYLEVGVFTGYSTLAVGMALPADGEIVACDSNEEWTDIARRYWDQAGIGERVHLYPGQAADSLESLIAQGEAGRFDFAFIDADKENYLLYYEQVLALLRPGGLMAIDNVLWGGAVIDPGADDEETAAIRAFNDALAGDRRVDISLVPIGDGLLLARKQG
uniref:Predicted O-methyltransferase YrrM n=1 Tax=Candidatus Kentrum sp. DK TaxID=2126562 RepID=A0A450RTU9_9GAMM|nr:MAG: Predicted O-methyltransferase YrrM [Candidatus Kentron sp. DK]